MDRYAIIKLASIVSSWYQQEDLHVEHDSYFGTVTVSKCNAEATFIGDEFDKALSSEVLNHVISIDHDDKKDDAFYVVLPETLRRFKVNEKIVVMGNAAKLTATAILNGMCIELYTISIVGNKRRIMFPEAITEDSVFGSEPLSVPEFRHDVLDLIAEKLASITDLTPIDFRNIELVNGDRTEVVSCIEYIEKEPGKLFCKVDIKNKSCVFGYNHYNNAKGTFEPCLEFHSKW